jgi:hypothetical protein
VLTTLKTSTTDRVRKGASVALWNIGERPKTASIKKKPKSKPKRSTINDEGPMTTGSATNSEDNVSDVTMSEGHIMISYDHQHKDVSLLQNIQAH